MASYRLIKEYPGRQIGDICYTLDGHVFRWLGDSAEVKILPYECDGYFELIATDVTLANGTKAKDGMLVVPVIGSKMQRYRIKHYSEYYVTCVSISDMQHRAFKPSQLASCSEYYFVDSRLKVASDWLVDNSSMIQVKNLPLSKRIMSKLFRYERRLSVGNAYGTRAEAEMVYYAYIKYLEQWRNSDEYLAATNECF